MKKYFDHILNKEPHHRRQHAMQVAGVITAAVFVVWVTTLGVSLGSGGTTVADADQSAFTAGVANSPYEQGNQLMVASTTQF